MPDGCCDGGGSRGAGGRYLSHAAATFRAVDPLAVAVIEPAFRAALMLGGRPPPLVPLRGLAAARPTVGLPPPAGPTEVEHRPAPRPAAAQRAPPRGSGSHAWPPLPRRRRRVRRRRGGTGETDRQAWEDGGARPGGRRSRAHGASRLRDRQRSKPSRRARVGVKISARVIVRARQPVMRVGPRAARRRYQRIVARASAPLSVPSSIGLSRRWASTPSSRFRRSRSSTPRP